MLLRHNHIDAVGILIFLLFSVNGPFFYRCPRWDGLGWGVFGVLFFFFFFLIHPLPDPGVLGVGVVG